MYNRAREVRACKEYVMKKTFIEESVSIVMTKMRNWLRPSQRLSLSRIFSNKEMVLSSIFLDHT